MDLATLGIILAILLANSLLNIVVWAYILNKMFGNLKDTIREVQKTLKIVRGDYNE